MDAEISVFFNLVKVIIYLWLHKLHDCIFKHVKKSFRLKKWLDGNTIKSIRNLFELKKEGEAFRDIIIRDIKILFEKKYNYCKPKSVGNFRNNNYIECESKCFRNTKSSAEEFLNEIKP